MITPGPVSAWIGDCLWTVNPSRSTQPGHPSMGSRARQGLYSFTLYYCKLTDFLLHCTCTTITKINLVLCTTITLVFQIPNKTRCVAMPSLMAARWVDQNSGPIFRHLWAKVHHIKFACARVSEVCNAVIRLTMSCCVPEILAINSGSCPKLRRIF